MTKEKLINFRIKAFELKQGGFLKDDEFINCLKRIDDELDKVI